MEDEELSSASSGSLSGLETERHRIIKIVTFNFNNDGTLPSQWVLANNSRYLDVEKEINDHARRADCHYTLLVQTFGPFPCWKFLSENTIIPTVVHSLYLVDRNRPFLIALLRTEEGDQPFLIGKWHICLLFICILTALRSAISYRSKRHVDATISDV